jgi:hypothetical protein
MYTLYVHTWKYVQLYSRTQSSSVSFLPEETLAGNSRCLIDADWSKRSHMRNFYRDVLNPDWVNLSHAQNFY